MQVPDDLGKMAHATLNEVLRVARGNGCGVQRRRRNPKEIEAACGRDWLSLLYVLSCERAGCRVPKMSFTKTLACQRHRRGHIGCRRGGCTMSARSRRLQVLYRRRSTVELWCLRILRARAEPRHPAPVQTHRFRQNGHRSGVAATRLTIRTPRVTTLRPHGELREGLRNASGDPDGERQAAHGRGRRPHAAGGAAAREAGPDRHACRLRHQPVRRLRRACRWRVGEVLHHAGAAGGRHVRADHRGPRRGRRHAAPDAGDVPRTSRACNAASARPAW